MNFTGLHKTRLRGDSIIKDDRRVQFNFSAVAKGYACDAVADMLRRNGAGNYLVEIGARLQWPARIRAAAFGKCR